MLILQNGQRLENTVGKSELKISDFEEYGTNMNKNGDLGPDAVEVRAISTRNLLKSSNKSYQGELSWRVGLVLGAINFVVMALALASVNPRAGRSSNLIFVLLTFVVYSNLLSMGQSWVSSGRVGLGTLLLVMHGSVLMASLVWLAKRNQNWTLRDLLPRRRPAPTPVQTKALVQP
jgi:lipopolysaccharide export system permease protein